MALLVTGASPADPPTPPIDMPAAPPAGIPTLPLPGIPATPPTAGPLHPPPGLGELAPNLVAAQHGLPLETLRVVNSATAQYPHAGGTAFAYQVIDDRDGGVYLVTLDASGQELDAGQLLAAEEAAYAARYGRLEPTLFEQLAGAPDDEPIEVVIWLKEPPYVGPPRPDPGAPVTEAPWTSPLRPAATTLCASSRCAASSTPAFWAGPGGSVFESVR